MGGIADVLIPGLLTEWTSKRCGHVEPSNCQRCWSRFELCSPFDQVELLVIVPLRSSLGGGQTGLSSADPHLAAGQPTQASATLLLDRWMATPFAFQQGQPSGSLSPPVLIVCAEMAQALLLGVKWVCPQCYLAEPVERIGRQGNLLSQTVDR